MKKAVGFLMLAGCMALLAGCDGSGQTQNYQFFKDNPDQAKAVIASMKARGADVPIPTDVVCAKTFAADAPATIKAATDVADDDLILDIGPQTAALLAAQLKAAGTIVWNGPVGVFEFDAFSHGTETLARAIAASPAFSIAGGGDTLAAIAKYGIERDVGYISTGGGAFLASGSLAA